MVLISTRKNPGKLGITFRELLGLDEGEEKERTASLRGGGVPGVSSIGADRESLPSETGRSAAQGAGQGVSERRERGGHACCLAWAAASWAGVGKQGRKREKGFCLFFIIFLLFSFLLFQSHFKISLKYF